MTQAVILASIGAACWLLSLAWHPYKPCTALLCRRGRNIGSNSRRWGHDCKKCGGRGEIPRRGARQVRKSIGRPL